MINAALCRSKTNPRARGMLRAVAGHVIETLGCFQRGVNVWGLTSVWAQCFWGSPPGCGGRQDGRCSMQGAWGAASRSLSLVPARLAAMLPPPVSPTQPPERTAAVRACPVGSAARAQPSRGRFVLCLIPAVSSQPCAQENVSATPEQPRGPAAVPAGPT